MSESGPELSPFEKREVDRSERARAHIARRRETALHRSGAQLERLAAICVLLALVAGVAAGRALARSEAAPLRVTVFGADQLTPVEVARATGVEPDDSRSSLETQAIETQLRSLPRVATARAVISSGQVLIDVRERVAVATAVEIGDSSQETFAIDAAGAIFARATDDERDRLPRLRVASALPLGSTNPELVRGIALAEAAGQLSGAEVEAVEIAAPGDPAGLALHLRGISPRFVMGRGEPSAALTRLETLLGAKLPELANASEVDLRYADQAVIQNTAPVEAPRAPVAETN